MNGDKKTHFKCTKFEVLSNQFGHLGQFWQFWGKKTRRIFLGKKHNLWGDDSSKSLHPSKHQKHTPEVAKERLPRSLDSWLAWSDQHNQATIRVDLGIFGIWQNVPK